MKKQNRRLRSSIFYNILQFVKKLVVIFLVSFSIFVDPINCYEDRVNKVFLFESLLHLAVLIPHV